MTKTLFEKLDDDSLDAIMEVVGSPKLYNEGKSAMRTWFLERLKPILQEIDTNKADAVFYAKTLMNLRSVLVQVTDHIEDEGDRTYFGSTNDSDMLMNLFHKLDSIHWDQVVASSQQDDLYESIRGVRAENERLKRVPPTLVWKKCQCGSSSCKRQYIANFGTFYQGTGFDPEEVEFVNRAFMALQREGVKVQHVKSQGEYVIDGIDAELQSSGGPISEGTMLRIYINEHGRKWARPAPEFDDGRFITLEGQVNADPS